MDKIIILIISLSFLYGSKMYIRESRYLKTEYHRVKDSIEQEMIKRGEKVDKKKLKALTFDIHKKELIKLGYMLEDKTVQKTSDRHYIVTFDRGYTRYHYFSDTGVLFSNRGDTLVSQYEKDRIMKAISIYDQSY